MRYLVLLEGPQATTPPPPALMEAIATLGEEATMSGSLLDTAGLASSALGSRVSVTSGALHVMDGPFTETKELISYALYEVSSKAEAVEWTRRFLTLHKDLWPGWEGEARVLKVFGSEDFPAPQ